MRSGNDEAGARTGSMRRNEALEGLLAELNAALAAADARLEVDVAERLPKVFVVGPLRSGTTLLMQWLARTGLVAWPTNLLSRFYGAPWTGAKIQQLLTDPAYDFRGELALFPADVDFRSENGKTVGALAPNEFWYFWRRHLPALAEGWQSSADLERDGNTAALRDEINGLANLFGRPFALKAMILNQNLDLLARLFARPVFAWVRRDPVFNMQSALQARVRQYGTMERWYSFELRESPRLRELDPLHAVAGQIFATQAYLSRATAAMPEANVLPVDYEAFCADPRRTYDALVAKLQAHGACHDAPPYTGPASFACTNAWTLERWSQADAERAYSEMAARLADSG
jgi:hypothetical protein